MPRHQSPKLQPPDFLVALHPPAAVLAVWQMGEVAVLAGVTDELAAEAGISSNDIRQGVANAAGDLGNRLSQEVWRSSEDNTVEWLGMVAQRLERLAPMWRDVLGVVWSVSNTYLPPPFLVSGATGVRANTLRQLIDGEYTVADLHAHVSDLSALLAQGKLSQAQERLLYATSMVTAAVGGYVTAGVSTFPIVTATNWAYGKLTDVDAWIEQLAVRWVLAATIAEHDQETGIVVARSFRHEATELARSGPDAGEARQIRLLMTVYRALAAEDEQTILEEMPDLVRLRLNDALDVLHNIGLDRVSLLDASRSGHDARSPLVRSRWVVQGQRPRPGETVDTSTLIALAFGKPDEPIPHGQVASRLYAL